MVTGRRREMTVTQSWREGSEVVVTAESTLLVVQVRLPAAAVDGRTEREVQAALRSAIRERIEPAMAVLMGPGLVGLKIDLDGGA